MAACFAGDAKIGAGAAPFRTMRRDPPAAGAELREQMRQLVTQGAIDLGFAMKMQTSIKQHP
jgi:hypothetical protein